jgi:phosphatidylinositol alpha-1,6-mannosyltransferase
VLYAPEDGLALVGDVVFAGAHPWADLPPYFAAGDVFCMPTRSRKLGFEVEALGIVFLEASACGLPVVVGDSGGAPDTVRHGETGYVVDGRSVEDIASRLSELLLDRELAARLGASGRSWVVESWQWEAVTARVRSLLLGDRPVT